MIITLPYQATQLYKRRDARMQRGHSRRHVTPYHRLKGTFYRTAGLGVFSPLPKNPDPYDLPPHQKQHHGTTPPLNMVNHRHPSEAWSILFYLNIRTLSHFTTSSSISSISRCSMYSEFVLGLFISHFFFIHTCFQRRCSGLFRKECNREEKERIPRYQEPDDLFLNVTCFCDCFIHKGIMEGMNIKERTNWETGRLFFFWTIILYITSNFWSCFLSSRGALFWMAA